MQKTKKPRCKHQWKDATFSDTDIYNISRHEDACDFYWRFSVSETCALCSVTRTREATANEIREVIAKCTCARCGEGAHEGIDCIELLLTRVKKLERRLDAWDEWKRS